MAIRMLADKQLQRVKNKGIIHGYFHHWLLHKHKSTERQITDDGSDGARRASCSSRITLVSVLTIQYSVDQCKCAVTFTVRPALLTMCYGAQRCEGELTAPISLVPLAVARLLLVVSAEGDH